MNTSWSFRVWSVHLLQTWSNETQHPKNVSSAEFKLILKLNIIFLLQARQLLEQEYNSLISMGTERRPDEVWVLIMVKSYKCDWNKTFACPVFTLCLSVRMVLRRSPARPPGGRCLGRKTYGAWPLTPPRPCLLTFVPQPSPRPLLPWERFRAMVSMNSVTSDTEALLSAFAQLQGALEANLNLDDMWKPAHTYLHREHDRNPAKSYAVAWLRGEFW